MKNRLNLDFSLNSEIERLEYLEDYIPTLKNLRGNELNLMGSYLLWGEPNAPRPREVELISPNSPWRPRKEQSLDSLYEEAGDLGLSLGIPTRTQPRSNLNRSSVRSKVRDPKTLADLEDLWRLIDLTELELNFAEIHLKKRSTPPRQALLDSIDPKQVKILEVKAETATSNSALLLKRHLIELRQRQYQYVDSFNPQVQNHTPLTTRGSFQSLDTADILYFYPRPFPPTPRLLQILFPFGQFPVPTTDQKVLAAINQYLWTQPQVSVLPLNLTNPKVLKPILDQWEDLTDIFYAPEYYQNTTLYHLLILLSYYLRLTPLPEAHSIILKGKLFNKTNEDINIALRKADHPGFGLNYISTLYTQKIIPKIIRTIKLHSKVIQDLMFPENFFRCNGCGRILHYSTEFFSPNATVCRKCQAKPERKSKFY